MDNERSSINIRSVFGIPIQIEASWILLYAFLTMALAIGYFPVVLRGRIGVLYWIISAVTILLLFGSLIIHEFGHALTAHHFNIPVNRITLFISGGSVQMTAFPSNAHAEFWIATAGPLANIGITIFLVLLGLVIDNIFGTVEILLAPIKLLVATNSAIAIFNLLPVLPLDGGRAFRALMWRSSNDQKQATLLAGVEGQFVAYIFIVFGVVQVFSGNLVYGLWVAVTGFILDQGALTNNSKVYSLEHLKNLPVSAVMSTEKFYLPADTNLQEFFEYYFLRDDHHLYIIERENLPIGLFSFEQLGQTPRLKWSETKVSQIMTSMEDQKWVEPGAHFGQALQDMDANGLEVLPVVKDRNLLGLITRADIIHIIRKFNL